MTRLKWVLAALAVLLLLVAGFCFLTRRHLEKESTKLTTTYAADTATRTAILAQHDSVLKGEEPLPRKEARTIVATERKAADKVIATSEKRVVNLQKQLKPAWLRLFGELDYGVSSQEPLLEGQLAANVGAEIRLRKGTYLRGYLQQPLADFSHVDRPNPRSYHVGLRQEFRVF